MPAALLLPIVLRLAGPIAFTVAAMTAGAMNRSFLLVPLLALAASLTTILTRSFIPSPVSDLKAMLNQEAEPPKPNPFQGTARRLIAGLIGYALAFGLAALIAALFQTTEFEPAFMLNDIGFLVIPSALALFGAWLSARLGFAQMASMMGQMQDVYAQMRAAQEGPAADEEAFTFEGEVIDPDEDEPRS